MKKNKKAVISSTGHQEKKPVTGSRQKFNERFALSAGRAIAESESRTYGKNLKKILKGK